MKLINLHTTTPIFQKKPDFPEKLPFTENEQKFEPFLRELKTLECNIYTQRENLKEFYSAQDRCDYRELLKRRKNLVAKLTRIASEANCDYADMVINITTKKQYNRWAPKLLRAKTAEELQKAIELISFSRLYTVAREMLLQIIQQKKF